jgi:anti-sigma B factor antagonist
VGTVELHPQQPVIPKERALAMTKHTRVERLGDALVVYFHDSRITGELAIAGLGEELYAIVGRPDCLKLVLDFSDVEFLSSAMLGKLISINHKMKEKGGIFRLCGVCPNICLIFKFTALDTIFDIRDTAAEAAEA